MASQKSSSYERGINFGAGPAALPLVVLEKIQQDLMNFRNSGSFFASNLQFRPKCDGIESSIQNI
jgi:hypothetical protein